MIKEGAQVALTVQEKQKIIEEYGVHKGDTGSPNVQIALLSKDIEYLQKHFEEHKKDHHSKRGFLQKVTLRKSLMQYLRKIDSKAFISLCDKLNLRYKK